MMLSCDFGELTVKSANSPPSSETPTSSKLSGNLTDRGEKIRFYESLYQQYSRLDFTRIADRSVAIAGLEQRMVRDLGARGGFWHFRRRSQSFATEFTLETWQGSECLESGTTLGQVVLGYRAGRGWRTMGPLTSWTCRWVEWTGKEDEIHGPWADRDPISVDVVISRGLSAVARPFKEEPVDPGNESSDFEIIFDAGEEVGTEGWQDWRCVVVGTKRVPKGSRTPTSDRTHYLLVVAPTEGVTGSYMRIGVGTMVGAMIGEPMSSRIVVR